MTEEKKNRKRHFATDSDKRTFTRADLCPLSRVDLENLLLHLQDQIAFHRQETERHQAILEAIDEGFCIIEVLFDQSAQPNDYLFLKVNASFEKHTGLRNAVGRRMRELNPNHEEYWFEIYGRVVTSGEPIRFENEVKALNRWFDVYAFRFGAPEQHQVAVLFKDISARKKAAEELLRREATLNTVLDTLPVGIVITDAQGQVVRFNPATCELWGLPPDTTSWEEYGDWVGWRENGERITAEEWAMSRVLSGGGEVRNELVKNKKFGSDEYRYFLHNVMPLHDADGKLMGGVTAMLDITDLKQAEDERDLLLDEVEQARNRFQAVIENAPLGICAWRGPELVCELANSLYRRFAPDKEMIGRRFAELWPEESEPLLSIMKNVMRTGRPSSLQNRPFRIRKGPNDSLDNIFFDSIYVCLPADRNGQVGVLNITVETTEKVKNKQRIEEMMVAARKQAFELAGINRELEAFSYSLSHDLKGPLRAIKGFSDILEKEYRDKLDERGRFMFNRIILAAEKMNMLIDDMLGLSSISHRQLKLEAVDLAEIAQSVLHELRQTEPDREAEVTVAEPLPALADAGLLRIALANLIGNAWKYCGEVARLDIGLTYRNKKRIFYVRDNGPGFDMKYAHKIFEPFQRLHSDYTGTGIGLTIVHRVIQRHHGRIWVESEIGKGSTFYFSLPQ